MAGGERRLSISGERAQERTDQEPLPDGDRADVQQRRRRPSARASPRINSNSGPRFGVVLRYQDPLNYYLVSRLGGGTSALQISKVVNGIETVLKSMALPNPVSNTFFRLEGEANGTTLTLKLDGVQKLSVVDATFSSGTSGSAWAA